MPDISKLLKAAKEEGLLYIENEEPLIAFLLSLETNPFIYAIGDCFTCLYVTGAAFEKFKAFTLISEFEYAVCSSEDIYLTLGVTPHNHYMALVNFERERYLTTLAFLKVIKEAYPNHPTPFRFLI